MADGKRSAGHNVLVYPTTRSTVDHKQIIKDHQIDPAPYTKTSTSWAVKYTKPKGDH